MPPSVEYSTPPNTMNPIGPYSHISKVGDFITIGAVAGVSPETGELCGPDIASQTTQILDALSHMLKSVGSDLDHIMHINVFLKDMRHFADMNAAFERRMGQSRPARTAVSVVDLPKPGALVTMNLTAVVAA